MKNVLIAALTIAAFATAAQAGGVVTVVPEPVIVADTAASNQGIFVPIFALIMLILAHSN